MILSRTRPTIPANGNARVLPLTHVRDDRHDVVPMRVDDRRPRTSTRASIVASSRACHPCELTGMRACERASVRACERASVRACERARIRGTSRRRACARVRVCACARVRVCECARVRAMPDVSNRSARADYDPSASGLERECCWQGLGAESAHKKNRLTFAGSPDLPI